MMATYKTSFEPSVFWAYMKLAHSQILSASPRFCSENRNYRVEMSNLSTIARCRHARKASVSPTSATRGLRYKVKERHGAINEVVGPTTLVLVLISEHA